ncbi:hypothetical protein GQ53DRAFT_376417 [Thozetella sp. PMI_491]|nr:hypothetical protein GQ53DRAFT_376417 [Thozetella sp. PMI_491]
MPIGPPRIPHAGRCGDPGAYLQPGLYGLRPDAVISRLRNTIMGPFPDPSVGTVGTCLVRFNATCAIQLAYGRQTRPDQRPSGSGSTRSDGTLARNDAEGGRGLAGKPALRRTLFYPPSCFRHSSPGDLARVRTALMLTPIEACDGSGSDPEWPTRSAVTEHGGGKTFSRQRKASIHRPEKARKKEIS